MIWPVILSGGSGTRLWPVSRAATPKQFLALTGPATLLQDTAKRISDRSKFCRPVIVGNKGHLDIILAQLDMIGLPPAATILEPVPRNTAPAIALAARWIAHQDPAAIMLVMPSDHCITLPEIFQDAVDAALPAANDGWLVTFGIAPTAPETGYGYIKVGKTILSGVHKVDQFVEKPDAATAVIYQADGGYAWNGGIFLMRCDRYLTALEAHAGRIASAVAGSMADILASSPTSGTMIVRPDSSAFANCPSVSVDYAVMEHDDRVAVVPVRMGWSDVGSWEALHQVAGRDSDGNHIQGDVVAIGATNSLIRSDGPLVAAVGIDGLTIIATGDSILVAAAGHSQDVKLVVDHLAAAGRREHLDASRLVHPWGIERILTRHASITVSEIEIAVGKSCPAALTIVETSLTILSGYADILIDDHRDKFDTGSQISVPAGAQLAIHNIGDAPLRMLAVRIDR